MTEYKLPELDVIDTHIPSGYQIRGYKRVTMLREIAAAERRGAAQAKVPLTEPKFHMTSEQVVIIAQTLCSLHSITCGVDAEDCWKIYSECFLTDARVVVDELNAAHGIGEQA